MDVDARLQLFDFKTTYQFQTSPGVDQYNMPLYNVQTEGGQSVGMYPVYQGFLGPAYINGIEVAFHTQQKTFFNAYPNVTQQMNVVGVGNGSTGPYQLTFPIGPNGTAPSQPPFQYILKGHVDIAGVMVNASTAMNFNKLNPVFDPIFGGSINVNIPNTSTLPAVYITSVDANGNNIVVSDSGQFLSVSNGASPPIYTLYPNYGLLTTIGNAPTGLQNLAGGYSTTSNTINYQTGVANVTFPSEIPPGVNINAQCFYFQSGLPRAILYYNNTLTLRAPPSQQFLVQLEAYYTPAAFFNTNHNLYHMVIWLNISLEELQGRY